MSIAWKQITAYLESFSDYYPLISAWHPKVRSELPSGKRSVFALISNNGEISGLAITKNGAKSKLCHISIATNARADGGGAALMQAAAAQMIHAGACCIGVTTSEEVATNHGHFFARYGFSYTRYKAGRYRKSVDELEWSVSPDELARRTSLHDDFSVNTTCPSGTLVRLLCMPNSYHLYWAPMWYSGLWFGPRGEEDHSSLPQQSPPLLLDRQRQQQQPRDHIGTMTSLSDLR